MATRCAIPPESSRGRALAKGVRATRAMTSATSGTDSWPLPSPKATLRSTVSHGMSLGCWNTMPTD